MPVRRIAILFNPVSGSGRARTRATAIGEALTRAGLEALLLPTRPEPASTWLSQDLEGCGILIVVGGDGAVRLAAPIAAERDLPLYHARAGTENIFARSHRMGESPEAILAAIRAHRVRRLDLGEINGEVFVLMVSVGFDAAVVRGVAETRGASISHLTYVPVILRELLRWRAESIRVRVDDAPERELGRGLFFVANAPDYALRMDPVRDADPTDGLLDGAFLPCDGSPGALVWMVRCLLSKGSLPGVDRLRGRHFVIETSGHPPWQADGDPLSIRTESRRVEVSVRPAALPVLLPAPA